MKVQNGISLKPLTGEARVERQEQQLRDAAKMYENHFLGEMVKAMRTTVHHEDGLIKESYGEKIFAQQLDQKYVDGWADKGGVGLADLIYSQIKERYLGTAKKDFGHAGALPIAPAAHGPRDVTAPDAVKMKMIPTGGQTGAMYRFEVPAADGGSFSAQAPLAGRVAQAERLGDNWNAVTLDHGRGLTSELTFPGDLTQIGTDQAVAAGQKLGSLDPKTPVVAWKLDWPKA